eukprot:31976_1
MLRGAMNRRKRRKRGGRCKDIYMVRFGRSHRGRTGGTELRVLCILELMFGGINSMYNALEFATDYSLYQNPHSQAVKLVLLCLNSSVCSSNSPLNSCNCCSFSLSINRVLYCSIDCLMPSNSWFESNFFF